MTGGANFLQSLGWAVLNSLWQMALLWILYQVITGIFRKAGSSAKSTLATGLLIGGFVWFIVTFFSVFGETNASEAIAGSSLVSADANPELNSWLQSTLPLASIAYLLLLVFPVLHFVRNYRYVQVIRSYGLSKIDPSWKIFVQNIAARMGIAREVKIWISELVNSPVTIGFLKPVILVPVAAINHLTPQQVEAVLLHELSHIRRHDYLLNLVLHFIHTILYFNPFSKAFVRIVEKEREKSCDELVLQFQYNSHEYASALLTLEKAGQASRVLTMASGGKKADLLTRIELIMGIHKKKGFSFNRLAGFMAGLLCVIGLNAILIISKPANAHRAADFASLRNAGELFRQPVEETTEDIDEEEKKNPGVETEATVVNQLDIDRFDDEIVAKPVRSVSLSPAGFMSYAFANHVMHTAVLEEVKPMLTELQQKDIKEAIESSRKVLVNSQWNLFEKNMAEVFTEFEKEKLKSIYVQEFDKIDWKAWENRLAAAYNSIEWDKVNSQLELAVNEIRLDSLQKVYSKAIDQISTMQEEMQLQHIESIPDTEVDLCLLEQRKKEYTKELNRMKEIRVKKIVKL